MLWQTDKDIFNLRFEYAINELFEKVFIAIL